MLKRVKSVSMLLFLMAASTGSMNAVSAPAIASSNAIEQQTETCKGVVKDAMGETVIGASVVVKGTTNGTITGIDGDFTLKYSCYFLCRLCYPGSKIQRSTT